VRNALPPSKTDFQPLISSGNTQVAFTMSVVTLLDVKVLNNPAAFDAPYQFEITFESLENLQKDLEWKLTYVGSAQRYVSHG